MQVNLAGGWEGGWGCCSAPCKRPCPEDCAAPGGTVKKGELSKLLSFTLLTAFRFVFSSADLAARGLAFTALDTLCFPGN